MRLFAAVLAVSVSLSAFAASGASPTEICGVIADSPSKMIEVPSLHVLSLTSTGTFSLPSGLPAKIGAVFCERANLLPAANDYKVLQAGFPFALKDPNGAVLWLELRNGQIALSYKKSALSQSEVAQLQTWADHAQILLQTPASASSGT